MKFAVEAWDPEYGSSFEAEGLIDSTVEVDPWVERDEVSWAPIAVGPEVEPAPCLLFVDGVRRIEAHVWVQAPEGGSRLGVCASYAAGAVRCDGRAEVVSAAVRRAVFCPAEGADAIVTKHGTFDLHAVADDDPTKLSLALQRDMGGLEVEVAEAARGDAPVVVDGPLKPGQERPGFVGYIKTHRTRYGPELVQRVVGRLGVGERTPLLLLDAPRRRYTWYLRLPGPVPHDWAGIVRLEIAADQSVPEAAAFADCLAASLPRFASTPHKDSRAPQNLYPIAGLERELRRRLGDPQLWLRALREAAAAAAAAAV